MEYFSISKGPSGFHVEGVPDAIKLIRANGPIADRISGLALHQTDLRFADQCLDAINQFPESASMLRAASWRSAVMHFGKCFGSSAARFQLNENTIYKNEPALALEVYEYFKNLRNKNIIHDENSLSQSITGAAAINRGDKPYKIEKIVCFAAISDVLGQENFSNLKMLIQKALEWVDAEFETCCQRLSRDLEMKPYDELFNMDVVMYSKPDIDDVGKNRNRP